MLNWPLDNRPRGAPNSRNPTSMICRPQCLHQKQATTVLKGAFWYLRSLANEEKFHLAYTTFCHLCNHRCHRPVHLRSDEPKKQTKEKLIKSIAPFFCVPLLSSSFFAWAMISLKPAYTSYLGEKQIDNLRLYKYAAVDKSPISRYILKHYWDFAITLFPRWIAYVANLDPNTTAHTNDILLVPI